MTGRLDWEAAFEAVTGYGSYPPPRNFQRDWEIWAAYTRGGSRDGTRGHVTYEALAQTYGVTRTRIQQIVRQRGRILSVCRARTHNSREHYPGDIDATAVDYVMRLPRDAA